MSKLYSKSTESFYLSAIHGSNIPSDAVEVSDDEYATLMNRQPSDRIVADSTGAPMLQAPEPPTLAQTQSTQISILTQAYAAAIAQPVSYTSKAGVAKTYQADPGSIANLQNMLLACSGAAATPTGFYWVSADNTQVPFAFADLQGLAAAMGAQGFTAFAHLQTLKAEVLAATTAAAVAAITF